MTRYLLFFIISLLGITASAQYANMNYDQKTIAAMASVYGTGGATEAYYNEQVKKILANYTAAEVAAATIFSSKYLERKALTDLGIWTSSTENYYYQRIRSLVATKIMPKVLRVAQLMMKNPENAIYWGSYLLKICAETKALCQQFEAVVTNSRLGFGNVYFLEFTPEVKQLFDFAHENIVNWDNMQRLLTEAPEHFTKESLKADVDKLYAIAVDLASQTAENVMNRVLSGSDFNSLMEGKISGIYDAVTSCERVYGNINALLSGELKRIIGESVTPQKLFRMAQYDISDWVTNYADRSESEYYTQRWYIYNTDSGTELITDYDPTTDSADPSTSPKWYCVTTSNQNYQPTPQQWQTILVRSESQAGWSQAKVNYLNSQQSKYTYTYTASPISKALLNNRGQFIGKAFGHIIRVYRKWDTSEVVYEQVFDSYSMDLEAFQRQMQAKLDAYNDNEDGALFLLGSDDRNFYPASSAEKLKGVESVIISMTCHDGAQLISGSSSFKCRTCGSSVNAHTMQCAMKSTLNEEPLDTSELDALETNLQQRIASTQAQIKSLEAQNAELRKQLSTASPTQATEIRMKYNANQNRLTQFRAQLSDYQQQLSEVQAAKEEAKHDDDVKTDDYYRIPAIMQDCKSAYNLTWDGEGRWINSTFTREAHSPNINGVLTFRAKVAIARPPKYFIGIKIWRAVVQIEYELTAQYSDTQVAEIISLDKEMTDEQKQKLVNDHLSALAKDHPKCDLDVEYVRSNDVAEDTTSDKYHLLWSSDRLEIARGVDTRLHNIYADLVSIEKMMNYKRSIIDVLLSISPPVNAEQGRRQTIIQQARKRWLSNAARTSHSNSYNGKYERGSK